MEVLPNRFIASAVRSREKKKEAAVDAMHNLSCFVASHRVVQMRLHLVQHHVRQLLAFFPHDSWLQVPLQDPIHSPLLQAHPLVRWRGRLLALVVLPMKHSL